MTAVGLRSTARSMPRPAGRCGFRALVMVGALGAAFAGCGGDNEFLQDSGNSGAPPCPDPEWTEAWTVSPDAVEAGGSERLTFEWQVFDDVQEPVEVEVRAPIDSGVLMWRQVLNAAEPRDGFAIYRIEAAHPFGAVFAGVRAQATVSSQRPRGCARPAQATTDIELTAP